ncbi:zinc finger C2HC domain-containing protein 1C [Patella vulgata]|uniref:zinc finger C2HC domain-containing protein 1C n=1 Tax=Patella vulgata TaxID=6465 RepID=UPI0021801CAE|nr:zinc finger C2HC domain-containing protein 1C [Patella vulgata]
MQHQYYRRDTSPSKIPRPRAKDASQYKPTKLDLMKEEYHRKLMKEREHKIIEMYENNQKKALERVSRFDQRGQRGNSVRNFFEEARALEASGNMNAIQQHYNRSNKDTRRSSVPNVPKTYGKRSAGKDRENLLAPIDRKLNGENPFSSKPQRARQPMYSDGEVNRTSAVKSYSAPVSSKSKRIDINDMDPTKTHNLEDASFYSSGSSSPPELAQLSTLKRKNSINKKDPLPGIPKESQEKLTDFQKWQLEQVRAREERLHRHRSQGKIMGSEKYDSDEGIDSDKDNQINVEEEILRKQQELMNKIAQQQAELDRIKTEKDKQAEMERREEEKRQQKAIIEREKQQKKERERQRKQEEKDRKEEMKRQMQEERRAAEEEAERMREEENQRKSEQRQEYGNHTYRHENQSSSQNPSPPPSHNYRPHPPANRKPATRPQPRNRTPTEPGEEIEHIPGPDVNFYIQAAAQDNSGGQSMQLGECRMCGRRFAVDRLAKHENACKTAQKKRKKFDPTKMRTQGTEMAPYQNSAKSKSKPAPKKQNWRKQHESFIESIRYAKKVTDIESKGGDIRDLTPPPPTENPDYVACPHCSRTFNSTAAERHIPRCKDIKGKPAISKRR